MNKIIKKLIILAIVVVLVIIGFVIINKTNLLGKNATKLKSVEGITVVPTMEDTITEDSSWCGTFQLVWNDMKNEVVKKDIVFDPQLKIVENLNKEDFNEKMISDEYYFKIYGLKSIDLKEQIENSVKEKFNQTSDILYDADWSEDNLDDPENPSVRRYFFYTMLYKKFDFLRDFDKLDNEKFGQKYKNVEYFGIDENTKDIVGKQITVMYYNSKDDFAVLISSKTNDQVIFCKSPKGRTFNEIYDNMYEESDKYTGSKSFEEIDEFKAPKLEFNEKREYEELENKQFETADPVYDRAEILKAMQSIKFSLDEKGGEIKSSAWADLAMIATAAQIEPEKEKKPRYFYVDDTFVIFLKEQGKAKPYFAARIDDITKYQ